MSPRALAYALCLAGRRLNPGGDTKAVARVIAEPAFKGHCRVRLALAAAGKG